MYSSSSDIGGFQFAVSGVNVSGAFGGAAEDAGFHCIKLVQSIS